MDLTGYKHILWDWNGTLLDDLDLCLKTINQLLADRQLPVVSRERYREIFGFPVIDYYLKLGFDFTREPWEEVSTEFITAYESGRPTCKLMSGASSTLQHLAESGISQSILSASKINYLDRAIREYELQDYFIGLAGLEDHHAGGKTESGIRHLEKFRLDPATTLMIGDTLHDAETARVLGVDCVLIPRGHQNSGRLKKAGVPLVSSLFDLNSGR
ncbi:MAG: HAD family hydrolase [Anaerolineales bacterium]|nr:HAD family hydrolase [Anaerolineales bacterium]